MKAYSPIPPTLNPIQCNESTEGEPIETKVDRILNNGEPIDDGTSPTIYTNRKDGVAPEHNIRTDRFELAIEAMDQLAKNQQAKRQEFHEKLSKDNQQQQNGPAPADPK